MTAFKIKQFSIIFINQKPFWYVKSITQKIPTIFLAKTIN